MHWAPAATRVAACFGVCLALACSRGAGGAKPGRIQPADIAALEAQLAQHPEAPALALRLAKAYYAAGRFAEARRAVATALQRDPTNGEGQSYLGFVYEGLVQYDSARAVYTRLLASKPDKIVHRLLAGRLVILTRKELQFAARQAIAREALLAQTPPDPNTVAVMPFRYTGRDSTLRPLERGLAALVVTDLSRVRRLKLVERARLQTLLDELLLAESGRVDPATGARSGRLVGAAQVVQGQFSTEPTAKVRVDATVVRATDAQVAATGSNTDQLRALFDIEKAVVFQLLDKLGITLTPAERTAISERPTRDIQAFLLYSRGLEAEDRGDFAVAASAFREAAQRDPGFQAAAEQAAASQAAQAASGTSASDVAATVGGRGGGGGAAGPQAPASPSQGTLLTAINSTVPTGASTLQAVAATATMTPPSTDPNRICEGAACDGPARSTLIGTLIIILKRP